MVKASRQFWYGSRLNRMGGESKHNRGTHTYIHIIYIILLNIIIKQIPIGGLMTIHQYWPCIAVDKWLLHTTLATEVAVPNW